MLVRRAKSMERPPRIAVIHCLQTRFPPFGSSVTYVILQYPCRLAGVAASKRFDLDQG